VSQQYDNNMRGTLGKNKRREKDSQPEYTGKCEIDGRMYWISAWVKLGQGEKFFSLSFKPQDQQTSQEPRRASAPPPSRPKDMDDDIPF
jgi:hypothetical protein